MIRSSLAFFLYMIALSGCMNKASGSVAGSEFRSLLHSTDCTAVLARRAFNLRVLGRSFPISSGYDFHGFEIGEAVFRKAPDGNHPGNSNIPVVSPIDEAASESSRSFASITYYLRRDDSPDSEKSQGFEVMEWEELRLYYRRTIGGQVVKTISHQLIAHLDGNDNALRITSTNSQDIADIVGCSTKI